jgi:glutamate:GABA antiporter
MPDPDALQTESAASSQLRRVLGRWDLVLLFVVAITNLNVVPVVAANGAVTVWLWLIALALFFWPQGVAVIELAHRYPQEGGIYVWTKELFGDFHGFVSGWCYWTNNIFYVPTVLLYMVGIGVYVGGSRSVHLGENRLFVFLFSLALLWLLTWLNVRGLGVGKWVNNAGGIGTALAAIALIGLAAVAVYAHGSTLPLSSFSFHGADWRLLSSFGVICFGLVGLELGSVMGDEIRDPRHTLPSAVMWGGIICGTLFVLTTLAVLLAVPQREIGVVQGILQAVSRMATQSGAAWLVPPIAFVLTISTAGIASAWFSGSARIPFVAGLDRYLPSALGKVHSRYHTPHVAMIVQALLSMVFLGMSFLGASVKDAYLTMLDLAVILQLVPFVYMYAAIVRLASRRDFKGVYGPRRLWISGVCGLVATILGMILAMVPSEGITSIGFFEFKMCVGVGLFLGVATLFFWHYSRRGAKTVVSN